MITSTAYKTAATLLLTLVVNITPALAAGSSGAGHEASIWDIRWYWINFIIYVVAMTLLLRKPVRHGWNARRHGLIAAIQGAQSELKQAQAALSEAKLRTSSLQKDISEIQKSIAEEGGREVARILDEAETRAKKIILQAQDSLTLEERGRQSQLRKELIDIVIEKARAQISTQHTTREDKALRTGAVAGIKELVH